MRKARIFSGDNNRPMQNQFIFRRDSIKGRRINATPESDIPQKVIEFKTAASAAEAGRNRQRSAKVFSVAGTVLVWLPVLITIGYAGFTFYKGIPLSVIAYLYLLVSLRLFHNFGALSLYIGARLGGVLRKPIGWIALTMALLYLVVAVVTTNAQLQQTSSADMAGSATAVMVLLAASELLALILNVFSILLCKRIFPKKDASVDQ